MAKFTVRIELRDAESSDYDELYHLLKAEGFSKYIKRFNNSITYKLPTAEYNYSSETESTIAVRNLAYRIAKKVNDRPAVLVTKSTGNRRWKGLDEA